MSLQVSEDSYVCVCPQGFEGTRCENKMLTCADTPCFHGGKCKERGDGKSYVCECPAGYTGHNCERKVNKCTSLQCVNGIASSFFFTNKNILFLFLEIVPHTLLSLTGGHCVVQGNLRLCSCRSGFAGLRCEININECSSNPCANGSTCVDRINDYTCVCPPGYTGRHCDRLKDGCAFRPCQNGGTCVIGAKGRPACICPDGYTGARCQSGDVPLAVTPGPNVGWESGDQLVAISLGAGLVAVLVLLCMVVVVIRHVRKQRAKEQDSETMNNLSKLDYQKENLISTLELKNTNKKIDLEVDCPKEKLNHKHINDYHLDYKSSVGYRDEMSLLDKDENCEKMTEDKQHLSRKYR